MFRWFALTVFLAAISLSARRRWQARQASGTIPRFQEPAGLIAGRLLVAVPLFGAVLAYLANPGWMAWASLDVPSWARWIGVALGLAVIPSLYWVLSTLGANVSETVLTKPQHQLVTTGPYRWVRHPLYTVGIALFVSLGLMAANWFILVWAVVAVLGLRLVVIPREEFQLEARFGDDYRRYRSGTGSLLPSPTKMTKLFTLIVSVAVLGALSNAQSQSVRTFDTYVIDVEGGEATLFVSPTGESLLVDTGWPGFDGRDADRILAVARHAGITQIDHLVVTHYHADHAGGAAQLATRLPIQHFVDRGPHFSEDERAQYDAYSRVRGGGRRSEVKPGDSIAVSELKVHVIAAGGSVLTAPLPDQGISNPFCADFTPHGTEITSRAADGGDSRSLSLSLTYGRFRTVIMGDLTWNKEYELMCPNNPLGDMDVYLVSHHGSDTSGSPALVHALRPRAAVMNNGPRKGGAIQTFQILNRLPGSIDLWQNHYSVPGGQQHNRPDAFIANLDEGTSTPDAPPGSAPAHNGPAHWIKVSARADGSFTILNSRTAYAKEYPRRR